MPDDHGQGKMILLIVIGIMLVMIVLFLRVAVQSGSGRVADIFRMFVLIMFAIVAVCVYMYVKPSS